MPLVLGIGNPLRGDDGVGAAVVDAVSRDPSLATRVETRTAHQLLPEHVLELVAGRALAIVDARVDLAPGEVRRDPVPRGESGLALGHGFDPGSLVALAQDAYGVEGRVETIGVGVFDLPHGEGLSAVVQRAVPAAVEAVRAWAADAVGQGDQAASSAG